MAGPFDISTFDTAMSVKDAINPEVLARANRAARVAKYGEEAVAAMEAAGVRFGGAAPVASGVTGAPALDAGAPLSRYARLKSILNPNITGRGVARLGAGAARVGAVGGVVGGAVQSIIDTPEEVAALGNSVGIDTSNTGGRIGANVLNFAKNIGDYASFGVAPRIGRMLTGGSFFDPVSGAEIKPTGTSSTNDGLPTGPQSPIGPSLGATPGVSRVSPSDQAVADRFLNGDYTGDLPVGTGFMRNNANGDTRVFRGGGATPSGPGRAWNDKYGFGELITGLKESHRRAAATAALAAQGAYLRGEAAFMKAEEGNNKPENTTVIPSMVPGGKAEVIQVNKGIAKQLGVRKELPPGWTEQIALDKTAAWLKLKGATAANKQQAMQDLRDRGIDPSRLRELQ